MTAGERARRKREELGWGVRTLARRAGVAMATVSRFERGIGSTFGTAQAIYRALGLSMALLDREEGGAEREPLGV